MNLLHKSYGILLIVVQLTTQGITLGDVGAPPINLPPVVDSTPSILFTEGTPGTYNLNDDFSDPENDLLSYTIQNPLPNGLTLTAITGTVAYDGIGIPSISQHTATADDGEFQVTSPSFNIEIRAVSVSTILAMPYTGCARITSKNYAEVGASGEAQRQALAHMDIVLLGGFLGSEIDNGNPGFLQRGPLSKDIYDRAVALGNTTIIIGTYYNAMEAGVGGNSYNYAKSQSMKNVSAVEANWGVGNANWLSHNENGGEVATFGTSIGINLSEATEPNAEGDRYAVWHTKNVIAQYIQVQIDAGVPVENLAVYHDNYQTKARKSGIDWNGNGVNDDAQQFFDPENPFHVAGDAQDGSPLEGPQAVISIGEWRAEYRLAMDWLAAEFPGINIWCNTNTWQPNSSADLPTSVNIMPEYRRDTEPKTCSINIGFSEKNAAKDFLRGHPRSGLGSDGIKVTSGTWKHSYNNNYLSRVAMKESARQAFGWRVDCSKRATPPSTPSDKPLWDSVPHDGAFYNMFRMTFNTAQIALSQYTQSGIEVGTERAGRGQSCVLWDEYGGVNESTTKLPFKWAGPPIDDIQTGPRIGSNIWMLESLNGLFIVYDSSDEDDPPATVFVDQLPGGKDEWMRIVGFQDPSVNNGTNADVDFNITAVDSITLVRRSYYEPRLAA